MNQSQNSSNDNTREKPLEELFEIYIESMNIYEKVAFEIAKKDLESSYDMEKSIGFIDFLKENNYLILKNK